MKKEGLTTKQNEILIFIKRYTAKNNYPPSIREISGNNARSCKKFD